MSQYAPIIIPTLNRYEHFKRCVESLSKCTYASDTDLFIGLDFPPSEKYYEGYNNIKRYLSQIVGFKSVVILDADHNLGVNENCKRMYAYVRERGYKKYIFTEDDNEFSPNFLDYCNWALDYFEKDNGVLYICGYNLINTPTITNNIYKYNHAFCAWGCATWFYKVDRKTNISTISEMTRIVDNSSLILVFSNKVFLLSSLLYMVKKNYILGDTIIQALPDDEKWCVFPKLSMVRNYGHDGSGIHGGSQESYQRQINLPIDESTVFEPHIEGDLFTPEIAEAYKAKFGKKPFVSRLRCMARFLVYKLTGIIIVLERPKWLKRKKK